LVGLESIIGVSCHGWPVISRVAVESNPLNSPSHVNKSAGPGGGSSCGGGTSRGVKCPRQKDEDKQNDLDIRAISVLSQIFTHDSFEILLVYDCTAAAALGLLL
jgi:hypothetical protein